MSGHFKLQGEEKKMCYIPYKTGTVGCAANYYTLKLTKHRNIEGFEQKRHLRSAAAVNSKQQLGAQWGTPELAVTLNHQISAEIVCVDTKTNVTEYLVRDKSHADCAMRPAWEGNKHVIELLCCSTTTVFSFVKANLHNSLLSSFAVSSGKSPPPPTTTTIQSGGEYASQPIQSTT